MVEVAVHVAQRGILARLCNQTFCLGTRQSSSLCRASGFGYPGIRGRASMKNRMRGIVVLIALSVAACH